MPATTPTPPAMEPMNKLVSHVRGPLLLLAGAKVHFLLVPGASFRYNGGVAGGDRRMITAAVYGIERRRWRRAEVRRWKEARVRGIWRRSISLLFKFCLLAALLAETCWFAISFITVERVEETQGIYKMCIRDRYQGLRRNGGGAEPQGRGH